MSKRSHLWLLVFILGLLVTAVLWWARPQPRPVAPPPLKALQVKLVAYQPHKLQLPVHSQGTLAPRREIDLVAQVGGKITWVDPEFAAGAAFEAGTPLVKIEDADYRIAQIRARAQLAEAEQQLATERGLARQARREWRDLGDEQSNALFLRKPQLASAEAQLAAAKAGLEQAGLDLARTQITTPFAGRLRETYVNLGQYLSPGSKIARFFDSQMAEVRLPLTDDQVALLDLSLGHMDSTGPGVTLQATVAGELRQWRGHITRTEASLDDKTRLYHAVAEISAQDNAGQPLIMGLFVEAKIAGKTLNHVAELPIDALYRDRGLWYRDSNGQAHYREVKVLARDDERVWVKSDLPEGSEIIHSRLGYLHEGMQVEAVK